MWRSIILPRLIRFSSCSEDSLKSFVLLFLSVLFRGGRPGFACRDSGRSSWLVAESYQRECMHCKELFDPNARNRWHQRFCTKLECRKARKADSHRRWLSKPGNHDHFRGSANVERVRQWRKAHPGYWKRAKKPSSTLRDLVPTQPAEPEPVPSKTSVAPLQDLVGMQDPLLLGLISQLTDSPLQDHVE